MSASSCKVAIVGAGYMASEHVKAFRAVPGVEVAGIYSRSEPRARALAGERGVGFVATSLAQLYEKSKADLVVIAVPELAVRDVCLAAFEYPWTCLIEKPAGYDLPDAEAIAGAAAARGRRAYVALNRRHYSSTLAVLESLTGDRGARFIHVQDQEDAAAALAAGQPPLVVENWMYANAIHLIDYFMFLGRGPVRSVERVLKWTPQAPGIVAARILFDSGDVGLYQAVWNRPGPWSVAVTTQERRWEMRPLEQAALQLYGQRKTEPAAVHDWDREFKPGLRRQAELAARAASGSPVDALPTLADALASMRLTREIYDPS